MILFLHGMLGTRLHWAQVCAALPASMRRDVLCPTLDFSRFDAAHYAAHFRQRLPAHEPLIIVGNSLGCVTALGLQDRAQAVVLTAPPYDFTNEPLRLRREGVPAYIDQLYDTGTEIAHFDQHRQDAIDILTRLMANRQGIRLLRRMKQDCLAVLEDDSLDRAQHKLTCVIGAKDFTTPVNAFGAFLGNVAPAATLRVIHNCGHAIPLEAPAELAQVIAGLNVLTDA